MTPEQRARNDARIQNEHIEFLRRMPSQFHKKGSQMSIEQRAHEAAMAHLQSVGNTSSPNAQASYSIVYQGIIDAAKNAEIADLGGHQKALKIAVDMARLHEQGMFSVERMQLRTEIDGLKSTGRHSKETWWAENLSFAAVGAILGAFAMWLK